MIKETKNKQTEPLKKRCKYCGKEFVPKVFWQDYCEPEHQKAYNRQVQNDKRFLLKRIERLEKEVGIK